MQQTHIEQPKKIRLELIAGKLTQENDVIVMFNTKSSKQINISRWFLKEDNVRPI